MMRWRFSIPIDGLHDVIKQKNSAISVDGTHHGKGSKLIDFKTLNEYDEIANIVQYWNREVIYYYIDRFQILK